jgi:hypothetical protein
MFGPEPPFWMNEFQAIVKDLYASTSLFGTLKLTHTENTYLIQFDSKQ